MTSYRPELAEYHDKFFQVIDKIKDPKNQQEAVVRGVFNLFKAKKHDSVFPLINALEKRPFKGGNLRDVAIQKHLMKEHTEASKILWRNSMNTQQFRLKNMPMD